MGPSGDPMDPFAAFESGDPFSECGRWLRIDRDVWVERPANGGLPSIAHLSVPADGGDPIEHEVRQARWIDAHVPDSDDAPPELFVRIGTEVRALDLRSGAEQVMLEVDALEDVRVVGGRYLRITDLASTAWRIVDRETERVLEGQVAEAEAGDAGQGWSSAAGVMVRSGSASVVVWLPELELQELSGPWGQQRRLDDGRVVLTRGAGPLPSVHVLDQAGAAPRLVVENLTRYYGVVDDAVLGLVAGPDGTLDLVSFPLDGSGHRRLARNVDGVQAVTGDRWATMRDETSNGAELLLVDADGIDVGRVDTDTAVRFGPTFAQDAGRFEPTPWLAWVVDRRGRRGLYYAELESLE